MKTTFRIEDYSVHVAKPAKKRTLFVDLASKSIAGLKKAVRKKKAAVNEIDEIVYEL